MLASGDPEAEPQGENEVEYDDNEVGVFQNRSGWRNRCSPAARLPLTAYGSRSKAAAAPASARGVGVVEREAGALHRAHVIDGNASEILGAEPVDEDADAIDLRDHVVFQRALFDVQAVLEPGTATWKHADPEPGAIGW